MFPISENQTRSAETRSLPFFGAKKRKRKKA
jgi:hypothetical protein